MMQIYDVIIIGAGPAGSLAGYTLAKAGLRALLIDKSIFPRRKVCGGGLTHHAYQQLPFDISPVIQRTVDRGRISFRGKHAALITGKQPIAYLVERAVFDSFLLQKARQQQAIFLGGQTITGLDIRDDLITVYTNLDSYRSRFLIGADGVHSRVAKSCGLITHRATSLSYEARLKYPPHHPDQLDASIHFDFGTLLYGYGWIFPKGDHLNVGVFRSWPGKRGGRSQLMRFIQQHPSLRQADLIDMRAYPVSLGGKVHQLHQGRVLLAGDAANLADPWLGEGLYYALTSGQMAAKAILAHLSGQSADLSGYTHQVNESLTTQLSYARRLSCLVHAFPDLNVRAFSASTTLQGMVIDLLRGDRTYQQVWHAITTHFPRLLLNFIRKQADQ